MTGSARAEPFTFHWQKAARRSLGRRSAARQAITAHPLHAVERAQRAAILKHLQGSEAPAEWQGALPLKYHIGPGPVTLEMDVQNEERVTKLRSVIGVIRGREEPEKLVIVGNHLDAWSYGAVDPSSGTAALLEMARAFGEALKKGYRPRRTIVFANWDGEEPLLGGLDAVGARQCRADALERGHVHQRRHRRAGARLHRRRDAGTGRLPARRHEIGAGSGDRQAAARCLGLALRRSRAGGRDHRRRHGLHGAQEYIGVSCIDMYFDGPYGVYHSQYDDYFRQSTVVDPGFRYGVALSQLWSIMAWRLADADVLPMRYSDYARAAVGYIEAAEAHAGSDKPLRLDAARAAARRWEDAATQFETRLDEATLTPAATRAVNERLLQVERALVEPRACVAGRSFVTC
jgi:N-acetylated-alpha-linked acidic dipeptidase